MPRLMAPHADVEASAAAVPVNRAPVLVESVANALAIVPCAHSGEPLWYTYVSFSFSFSFSYVSFPTFTADCLDLSLGSSQLVFRGVQPVLHLLQLGC